MFAQYGEECGDGTMTEREPQPVAVTDRPVGFVVVVTNRVEEFPHGSKHFKHLCLILKGSKKVEHNK